MHNNIDIVPFGKEDINTVIRFLQDCSNDKFYGCGGRDRGKGKSKKSCCVVLIRLAVDLCTDIKTARVIKEDLLSKKISRRKAFTKILEDWLSGQEQDGNKTSAVELISLLSSNELTFDADRAKLLLYELSLPRKNAVVKSKFVNEEDNNIAEVGDAEEKEETSAAATVSTPSMENALSNSVILEEIFKKLSLEDKKDFRLVNSFWWKESLPFWRKSSRIHIINRDYFFDNTDRGGILLRDFVELFQEESEEGCSTRTTATDVGVTQNRFKLLNPPYRSYSLKYNAFLPEKLIRNWEFERQFWVTCGPFMENLTLSHIKSLERIFKIFQKLVLNVAPNLKQLRIEDNCSSEDANTINNEYVPWELRGEYPADKLAEKMETLILGTYINHEDTTKILKMCPNLKSLDACSWTNIEGLLERTGNGEYIKLQNMKFCVLSTTPAFRYQPILDSLLVLRKYVELLPGTLKDLRISLEEVSIARRGPYNLYAALAQCRSLESLQLRFHRCRHHHENFREEFPQWFMDLSIFSFPKLRKLKFIAREPPGYVMSDHSDFLKKFDFGTLKGMEKLEELYVHVSDLWIKEAYRRPGTLDWIYEGRRDHFAPPPGNFRFRTDYVYPEEEPILCENMKKFNFRGWEINAEDVTIISKWFPNLTSITAGISTEALPVAVESWKKLETLEIYTKDFIYLSQHGKLKEKNKYLKIIVHFTENEGRYMFQSRSVDVEVKEDEDGGLYYEAIGPHGFYSNDINCDDNDDDLRGNSNSSSDMDG